MTATWSTPSDFAVAHIVTAAEWNAVNGASSNEVFLYNALTTISQSAPVNVINTVYQNTTGRIRFISATGYKMSDVTGQINFINGSTNPPTITTDTFLEWANTTGPAGNNYHTVQSFVPPSFYYTISSATFTIQKWNEATFGAT